MSLFADYQPKKPGSASLDAAGGLKVRVAEGCDIAALAHIAAEREGTSEATQVMLFEKHLLNQDTGQSITFVADVCGQVVGFGKCASIKVLDDAPAKRAPEGWYLTGVIVSPHFRRRRIGHQLTQARLEWLARRTSIAYYFASAKNRVTIELHSKFGFVEVTRDFSFPNVTFIGGVGILFEKDLKSLNLGDHLC